VDDSPAPAVSTDSQAKSWIEQRPVLASLLALVLGAVMSGVVGIVVADRTASAALDGQEAALEADRSDRDRERLAAVYDEFAEAVNAYAFAHRDTQRCINQVAKKALRLAKRSRFDVRVSMTPDCLTTQVDFFKNANRVQSASNDVYVYGSPAAVRAQRAVSATLPPTLGGGRVELDLPVREVDLSSFTKAYARFLLVMCHELRYSPNEVGCVS